MFLSTTPTVSVAHTRTWVLGCLLAIACQTVFAQAMYRIKPLGYLGGCISSVPTVAALNGADEVTGTACNAHGDQHAFLWKNNGAPMVDLGPDEVGSVSRAVGINASGLVAGQASDSTGSFGFVSYGDGAPLIKIANGFGGRSSLAFAVNNLGQVTGVADNPLTGVDDVFLWRGDGSPILDLGNLKATTWPYLKDGVINASGQVAVNATDGDRGGRAFVWANDGTPFRDLGSLPGNNTTACCINASGQVTGISGGYHAHAFLWKNDGTTIVDLGTLSAGVGNSKAYGLNDAGQVAGWADTRWSGNQHAFVWMNDGTPMKDLGTLGGTFSEANDLNASGQVTGWAYLAGDLQAHAFLWRNDGTKIQDLNTLIDQGDPLKAYVTLISGAFINNLGDILAEGTDSRTGYRPRTCYKGPYSHLPRELSPLAAVRSAPPAPPKP